MLSPVHMECVSFGSSQSRADLLALGLAVTNVLTGLVWLSIRPKSISKVRVFSSVISQLQIHSLLLVRY